MRLREREEDEEDEAVWWLLLLLSCWCCWCCWCVVDAAAVAGGRGAATRVPAPCGAGCGWKLAWAFMMVTWASSTSKRER